MLAQETSIGRLPLRFFPGVPSRQNEKLCRHVDSHVGMPNAPFEVTCSAALGSIRHYDLEVPFAEDIRACYMRVFNNGAPPEIWDIPDVKISAQGFPTCVRYREATVPQSARSYPMVA